MRLIILIKSWIFWGVYGSSGGVADESGLFSLVMEFLKLVIFDKNRSNML